MAAVGGVLLRAAAMFSGGFSKRSVFKGAELSRLWFDWISSTISADQEIYNDFLRLRGRARELARNNPLIRSYLHLLETNVIGPTGFRFRAVVRNNDNKLNDAINRKLERAWTDWSTCVTVDGMSSLTQISQHLIRNLATDGEVIIRKIRGYEENRFKFALQQIDPDLLDHQFFRSPGDGQNEVRLGVEVNQWGRPVAYWFWDRHPTDLMNVSARNRIRVPADEVIHIFRADRANQTRGVTWLNSIMMPTKILDGYVEAELVAARTGAAKMGFFQWKDAEGADMPDAGEGGVGGIGGGISSGRRFSMEAAPGQFEMLPPGLEFKEWNPQHPSVAFPAFMKTIMRFIASGLGVNYNALTNDLEGVNYSSMRSGLLIERDNWRTLQTFWIERFLGPVYKEWLDCALLSSELVLDSRDPRRFHDVQFQPRGWAWVDPLKDVNAMIAAINNGLASRDECIGENGGGDFEDIAEQLAAENEVIKKYKLNITGLGVAGSPTAGDSQKEDEQDAEEGARNLRVVHSRQMDRAVEEHLAQSMRSE